MSWIFHPKMPGVEEAGKVFYTSLGYASISAIPKNISAHAKKALDMVFAHARPKAVCKIAPITGIDNGIIQAKGIAIDSRLWAALAKKIDPPYFAAVFALTLGQELEEKTTRAQAESLALGYLMHEAGARAIEMAADNMQEEIAKAPEIKDLIMTRRFSPGYCDWPTVGQKDVFRYLNPGVIGIRATSAWAMTPSKSITGAILFGKATAFASPCQFCKNKNCDHRRE